MDAGVCGEVAARERCERVARLEDLADRVADLERESALAAGRRHSRFALLMNLSGARRHLLRAAALLRAEEAEGAGRDVAGS